MWCGCAVANAAMEELDADNKRLSFQGRFADRDIVQVRSLLLCQYVEHFCLFLHLLL